MRALLVVALSALSVVSGSNVPRVTAPPGTPCPYPTTSVDMTLGSLNRYKVDYSANMNAGQLYSCDFSLRCPLTSNLMTLFVSPSKGELATDSLAMLYTTVNNSRSSETTGTLVAAGTSTSVVIPLTEGEGVGVNIWGNTGYVIVQATCHEIDGGSPSSNKELNYVGPATTTIGTKGTTSIPQNTAATFMRRAYTPETKQAYILTCSQTSYGDLMYGTPVVQLNSITGNVGADDKMTVLAMDSNISRVYTKDGATTFATAASTNRSSFEVSSAYAFRWISGTTQGGESGFTISYTCRNATGFTTSGAGVGMASTIGSGAAVAFSATAAAVVAVVACLLA